MALTQEDRINFSKNLVYTPIANARVDQIKDQLEAEKLKNLEIDEGYKRQIDDVTPLINAYQDEMQNYDGNQRTQVVEQDYLDSVNRIHLAPFFPNDANEAVPSLSASSNVWRYFTPFGLTKAIGKKYNESYDSIRGEDQIIDDINTQVAIIEGLTDITRTTGQECNAGVGGTCSNPSYTTEATCLLNGGIWTPAADSIDPEPTIQQALIDITGFVQEWEDLLNATYLSVPTALEDPNPTRLAQNNISKTNITDTISDIDDWQVYPNFDTAHGQTTCAGFNAYDPYTLNKTKLRPDALQELKDLITDRQTFYQTTRTPQINTNLGTIAQNMTNGEITTATGFYGRRFRFIDLRINIMNGVLTKATNNNRGQNAQDEVIRSNDNAAAAFASLLTVSKFRAPAIGSPTVHVLDATGFSASDAVYVVSDSQEEISATILSISNNSITLSVSIPQKYRENDFARIYKELL